MYYIYIYFLIYLFIYLFIYCIYSYLFMIVNIPSLTLHIISLAPTSLLTHRAGAAQDAHTVHFGRLCDNPRSTRPGGTLWGFPGTSHGHGGHDAHSSYGGTS
jgi:hypothetical protein